MTRLGDLEKRELPKPLALKKIIGPSFILLGLGLGSGELILWPYLASNYGMGIIWGAILGITFQFFLNMEISRYTLAMGESVFVGLTRKLGIFAPIWFIFSTLIPWIWPGIIASSAKVLSSFLGIAYGPIIPIILLVLIGIVLTMGPVLYKTQENLQKIVILIGVPFMFVLVFLLAKPTDFADAALGIVGRGKGFWFLPAGISAATFLGAFAYAGAGGNLNLAQSLYVKAKGYAMGKFSGQITSIVTGKKEEIRLEGATFDCNEENLSRFKTWWRRVNIEHAIVFWLTGALTIIALSLLAYSTVFGRGESTGIDFVINEGLVIAERIMPLVGKAFLLTAAIMLFFTQFSVFGSTGRIMCENLVLLSPQKFKISRIPLFFYMFLWIQILAGILIFSLGFTEPLGLVIVGAVLNAFTMFIYSGLILWLNTTSLEKPLRPGILRRSVILIAFLFYGGFSIFTIITNLIKLI